MWYDNPFLRASAQFAEQGVLCFARTSYVINQATDGTTVANFNASPTDYPHHGRVDTQFSYQAATLQELQLRQEEILDIPEDEFALSLTQTYSISVDETRRVRASGELWEIAQDIEGDTTVKTITRRTRNRLTDEEITRYDLQLEVIRYLPISDVQTIDWGQQAIKSLETAKAVCLAATGQAPPAQFLP
jgi:hypothetical protein